MGVATEAGKPSIAVVGGTGRHGSGLARRFAAAGFPVLVGSRDPNRAAGVTGCWDQAGVTCLDNGSAIAAADVVVLAVPFHAIDALLDEHVTRFKTQALVVDVSVPIVVTDGTLTLASVADGSTAQHIRARLPAHVRLAATFKTLPAQLLSAVDQSLDCDEFVCGDSPEARSAAMALVQSIRGLRAIDIGSIARARSLEHLTLVAIATNRRHTIQAARYRVVGL